VRRDFFPFDTRTIGRPASSLLGSAPKLREGTGHPASLRHGCTPTLPLPIITLSVIPAAALRAAGLEVLQRLVAEAGVDDRLQVSGPLVARLARHERAQPSIFRQRVASRSGGRQSDMTHARTRRCAAVAAVLSWRCHAPGLAS
jgi:hypothetical protein